MVAGMGLPTTFEHKPRCFARGPILPSPFWYTPEVVFRLLDEWARQKYKLAKYIRIPAKSLLGDTVPINVLGKLEWNSRQQPIKRTTLETRGSDVQSKNIRLYYSICPRNEKKFRMQIKAEHPRETFLSVDARTTQTTIENTTTLETHASMRLINDKVEQCAADRTAEAHTFSGCQ